MSEPDELVRAIAAEIERYLLQHPDAADSAAGIRAWWLSRVLAAEREAAVLAALELLEISGVVMRTELEGMATTFSSAARGRKAMH
jgi:hypothetical protein